MWLWLDLVFKGLLKTILLYLEVLTNFFAQSPDRLLQTVLYKMCRHEYNLPPCWLQALISGVEWRRNWSPPIIIYPCNFYKNRIFANYCPALHIFLTVGYFMVLSVCRLCSIGSEVLTAVTMKSSIFCVVRWKSTDISEEYIIFILMVEEWLCLLSASYWCLTWLTLWHWRSRRFTPPKRRLTSNGLHVVMYQDTDFFYIALNGGMIVKW
jgi:hypothetical protein